MHQRIVHTATVALLAGLIVGPGVTYLLGCNDHEALAVGPDRTIRPADFGNPNQPQPAPAEVYGSRLAPLATTFDDGTQTVDHARYWDTERGEACTVVAIEDQPSRCLPAFVWNAKPGHYADAACTKPVLVTDNCTTLPRYVRDTLDVPYNVCSPHKLEALYSLGGPIAGPVYKVSPLGNCSSVALGSPNVALPILDEVRLDAFVAVVP